MIQKVLENGKCYQDSDCIEGAICCGGQCLKTHNSDGTKVADCCAKKIPYILKTTFGEWSRIERRCCEKVPIVIEEKWENGYAPFVCCNTSECPYGGALYCTHPDFGPEQLLYYSCENYTCVVHQKTPAPEDFACDCSSGTCKIV
ncbi:MAG TPA: hypothetical protein PKK60_03590 [archaeon]|nr:hypothetical protein [archaeon]